VVVTKLERAKKSNRINVFIDEEYAFSVTEQTLIDLGLFKGQEFDKEALTKAKQQAFFVRLYDGCLARIASRPRSEYEIRTHLSQKLYKLDKSKDRELVERIVDKLKEKKYIADQQFAKWWVDNRMNFSPKSKRALQSELTKKGIDSKTIAQVLQSVDSESEIELARAHAVKFSSKSRFLALEPRGQREKLAQMLQRKGFGWDVIGKVLKT